MEKFKELERRLKVALDQISEGLEHYSSSQNASASEEALQAEINSLTEQNAKLSTLLAELEQERKTEAEEIQKLYNQLAIKFRRWFHLFLPSPFLGDKSLQPVESHSDRRQSPDYYIDLTIRSSVIHSS